MVKVVKEVVHRNTQRIWGYFKLSDKSKSCFEMTKRNLKHLGDGAWFQWGNSQENLGITVDRVVQLCQEWIEWITSLGAKTNGN